jgi:hypothetical protein
MRNIKLGLSGLLIGLSLLWWAAIGEVPDTLNFITVRNYFVQYSGIIAIGVFSVAMVLATRPRWIEPSAGGLDKSYRLHKWLGICGGVAAIFHWLGANGPKWLVGWGVIERPQRGPRADPETLGPIQRLLGDQREMAEAIGEWAFYAVPQGSVQRYARISQRTDYPRTTSTRSFSTCVEHVAESSGSLAKTVSRCPTFGVSYVVTAIERRNNAMLAVKNTAPRPVIFRICGHTMPRSAPRNTTAWANAM